MLQNKVVIRSITGTIFIIVLVSGMIFHKFAFLGVFLVIQILSQAEFYKLFKATPIKPLSKYGVYVGAMCFISFFLASNLISDTVIYLVLVPLLVFIPILELYKESEKNIENLAVTLLGVVYVALPFSMLNTLTVNEFTGNNYSYVFILSLFIFLWTNDTGAFVVGSLIGRNKLFERISPKKTWEGFLGGVVFAILAAVIISMFYNEISRLQWIIFAVLVAVFGTLGDLIESMIKRRLSIKDSSNLLPGHGGLLDRFDSTLLSVPVIFFYLKLLEYLN